MVQKNEEKKKSYVASLKNSFKDEENSEKVIDDLKFFRIHKMNDFIRTVTLRRPIEKMYQKLFLGNYFSSHNFGHNAINWRAYTRNNPIRSTSSYDAAKDKYMINKSRTS